MRHHTGPRAKVGLYHMKDSPSGPEWEKASIEGVMSRPETDASLRRLVFPICFGVRFPSGRCHLRCIRKGGVCVVC